MLKGNVIAFRRSVAVSGFGGGGCGPGDTLCGNACVDLDTDKDNCGNCGIVCPSGICGI